MKQYITVDQLEELSEEGAKKLRTWLQENCQGLHFVGEAQNKITGWKIYKKFDFKMGDAKISFTKQISFCLYLGTMIAFLDERNDMPWSILKKSSYHGGGFDVLFAREQLKELSEGAMNKNLLLKQADMLCDALWEAVKEVLEKK